MSSSSMTTPVFTYDPWERYVMAMEEIDARKKRITTAFNSANVPYAIIGGMAVAEWVATKDPDAVRTTKDVDMVLDRRDLEAAKAAAMRAGLEYHFSNGIPMFLERENPSPKRGVHLIWAGEIVRDGDPIAAPSVTRSILFPSGSRIICLEDLVGMKLVAFRRHDQTHLADMLNVGLWDQSWVSNYPPVLAERLQQIVDNPVA